MRRLLMILFWQHRLHRRLSANARTARHSENEDEDEDEDEDECAARDSDAAAT